MSAPRPTEPLKIQSFRRLWVANSLSQTFWWLHQVAAAWLMLELTNSALWVGWMSASATLPALLLSVPAGTIADLTDRRRVIYVSQSVMGAASLSMAVSYMLDLVTPELLLALGILLGIGLALDRPAWQTVVPEIVPRPLVPTAVSMNSVANNAARAIGPVLGGVLVAALGAGVVFLMNGLSYGIVIVAVGTLGASAWRVDRGAANFSSALSSGLRFARFTPAISRALLIVAMFALSSSAVPAMLPVFTSESLGGGSPLYGLLVGCLGIGAMIGALARDLFQVKLGSLLIPAAILMYGIGGWLLALTPQPAFAIASLVVVGAGWSLCLATLHSTVVLLAPKWVRGRTMSYYFLALLGFLPLGSILSGIVGEATSARTSILAFSTATAGLGLGLLSLRIRIPATDSLESPEPVDSLVPAGHPSNISGSPVMVTTTWTIAETDLEGFLDTVEQLRLVRLRTGAHRWTLYRNAGDPRRMTEVFLLSSWEDHLAQHQRLDPSARAVIRRLVAFDISGEPVARHLVAVDVTHREDFPTWTDLLSDHQQLHREDGSISIRSLDGEIEEI